jgi:hypothetical protein
MELVNLTMNILRWSIVTSQDLKFDGILITGFQFRRNLTHGFISQSWNVTMCLYIHIQLRSTFLQPRHIVFGLGFSFWFSILIKDKNNSASCDYYN